MNKVFIISIIIIGLVLIATTIWIVNVKNRLSIGRIINVPTEDSEEVEGIRPDNANTEEDVELRMCEGYPYTKEIDYYTKGKVLFHQPEPEIGPGSGTYEDICISDKELREYWCRRDELMSKTYTCLIGCQNGACLSSMTHTAEELEIKEIVYDFYDCYFDKNNAEIGMTAERLAEIIEECDNSIAETYRESGVRPIPFPWQDCCPEAETIIFGDINIAAVGASSIIDIWGYWIRVNLMLIDDEWKIVDIEPIKDPMMED